MTGYSEHKNNVVDSFKALVLVILVLKIQILGGTKMAKMVLTCIKQKDARRILMELKKGGFIVKNNKINENIAVGDVLQTIYPQKIFFKVVR